MPILKKRNNKKPVKNKRGSFKQKIILMSIVPIIILGIILATFSANRFRESIYVKEEEKLKNMSYTIIDALDKMYPGDYKLVKSDTMMALKKGSVYISSNNAFINNIKRDTDTEVSIIYGNIRFATTLKGSDGEDMTGTSVNSLIMHEVIESGNTVFYKKVSLQDKDYAANYMPLYNSDGQIVGMLALLRSSDTIDALVRRSVSPIIIISVIATVVVGFISTLYSQKFIRAFHSLRRFILSVEHGDLESEIDYEIRTRNDELGEVANGVMSMQKAIRQSIERDALTGLYNRRYANKNFNKILKKSFENGTDFSVCIADIDFFKKINDTYGHDAGDCVLVTISNIIRNEMLGKGFAARWGGEEFLLVYDKADMDTAAEKLEMIRRKIEQTEVVCEENVINVTMSFGVTKGEGTDIEKILKEADNNLYKAKENGRNRVVKDLYC